MRRGRWSDLLPDLLRDIAGSLHVVADFIKFHAVCKPWRNSRDLLSRSGTTTNQLLPWLLLPTPLRVYCIFSKSSYRLLPPPSTRRTNWVCSANGSTVKYLTVKELRPTLHDPLTGAVTELPPFPYMQNFNDYWKENPCGIVYGDGTILLYSFATASMAHFRAALLHPGDLKWTFLCRVFKTFGRKKGEFCAAYHAGRIMLTMDDRICHVIMPGDIADVLVPRPLMMNRSYSEQYNYILESHGELLWASVQVQWSFRYMPGIGVRADHILSVSVHALQEPSTKEKAQWVMKEGHCLADRVLFLGSPNSFAIDASLLGGQGGYAYFVYNNRERSDALSVHFGVVRYNFVDCTTEFMERLPQEWDNDKCTWLVPQPTISPIQEIIERKKQKTAPISSPSLIFYVERY
ncbi:unnamed protein product [Alopecurus aequalis]